MGEPVKRKKTMREIDQHSRASAPVNRVNNNPTITTNKPQEKTIYFVPGRIQLKRLKILKSCAERNNYAVVDTPNLETDYIVTEFESKEQIFRYLNLDSWNGRAEIVSVNWFTESVKSGCPLPVSQDHRLKPELISIAKQPTEERDLTLFNCFACQRKTPLLHKNQGLTEALEIVARHADLRDDSTESDWSRALAFRKAAGAIKSLPFKVTKISQITKLKDVGKHSLTIIQDIVEDGFSPEVEQIKNDEWFQVVSLFTTVFGVGQVTAKQWHSLGLRTMKDLRDAKIMPGSNISDYERINYGVAFHEDLMTPVTRKEADIIFDFIKETLLGILPGTVMELMGGFRRGKPSGHDVDILVTHPESGKEVGVLRELHEKLTYKNLILYGYMQKGTVTENLLEDESSTQDSISDDFEKCFYILKFPKDGIHWEDVERTPSNKLDFKAMLKIANVDRNWRAIRVDVVLSPIHQWPFAVVGWTGNKGFNRSIRNYAKKKMQMRLTSTSLWSYEEQRSILATSEQEIFSHLKLDYLEPWDRNV